MTILHLVTDAGGRSGSIPTPRKASRPRAHLKLVADSGGAHRAPASTGAPPRRHSVLTLAVAAAAIAAAGLATTAFVGGPAAVEPRAALPAASFH